MCARVFSPEVEEMMKNVTQANQEQFGVFSPNTGTEDVDINGKGRVKGK